MIHFNEEVILTEFFNSDTEKLLNKYTKADLVEIYVAIYGAKPLSSMKKEGIIQTIRNRANTIRRARAFQNLGG